VEKRRDQRVGPAHNNEGQQRIKETLSHNSGVSVLHYIHNSGPCRVKKRIRRETELNLPQYYVSQTVVCDSPKYGDNSATRQDCIYY
jgi:hypothetical protein